MVCATLIITYQKSRGNTYDITRREKRKRKTLPPAAAQKRGAGSIRRSALFYPFSFILKSLVRFGVSITLALNRSPSVFISSLHIRLKTDKFYNSETVISSVCSDNGSRIISLISPMFSICSVSGIAKSFLALISVW